jgi:hypothetical protein
MAPRKRRQRKAKQSKLAAKFPRLSWSRSPVQHPHSSPKGIRGYDRKRAKDETKREIGDS